jgi:hypothetical protein
MKLGLSENSLHSKVSQSRKLIVETNQSQSQSQSYVTTNGQSASLSWNKAPIWGLRPDLYYCQTVAGF